MDTSQRSTGRHCALCFLKGICQPHLRIIIGMVEETSLEVSVVTYLCARISSHLSANKFPSGKLVDYYILENSDLGTLGIWVSHRSDKA